MPKRTVLSVDDDEVIQVVITSFLEGAGYSVVTAYSGEECLDYLSAAFEENLSGESRSVIPAAVLLDVVMPGMNGFEVCRIIRNRFSVILPVILLSARISKADILHGLSYGMANDYLTKPFDRSILLAKLEARIALMDMTHAQASQKRAHFLSSVYKKLSDVSPGTPAILIAFRDDIASDHISSIFSNLSSSLPDSGVSCLELQFGLCLLISDSADVLIHFCCSIFNPPSALFSGLCFVTSSTPYSPSVLLATITPTSLSFRATSEFKARLSNESLDKYFSPSQSPFGDLLTPIDDLLTLMKNSQPVFDDACAILAMEKICRQLTPTSSDYYFLTMAEQESCRRLVAGATLESVESKSDEIFQSFSTLRKKLFEVESGIDFEKVNLSAIKNRYERANEYKAELAKQLDMTDDIQSEFITLV